MVRQMTRRQVLGWLGGALGGLLALARGRAGRRRKDRADVPRRTTHGMAASIITVGDTVGGDNAGGDGGES